MRNNVTEWFSFIHSALITIHEEFSKECIVCVYVLISVDHIIRVLTTLTLQFHRIEVRLRVFNGFLMVQLKFCTMREELKFILNELNCMGRCLD